METLPAVLQGFTGKGNISSPAIWNAGNSWRRFVFQVDAGEYRQQAISTIICEGDAIGAVILCSREEREKMGETESKLVAAAAGFLGRQMEQ